MSPSNAAHSVVEPSASTRGFAGTLVVLYAILTMIPLIWIVLTSFQSPDDAISYPPKILFTPSLEGYCNLFTTRSRQTPEFIKTLGPPQGLCDSIARDREITNDPDLRRFGGPNLGTPILGVPATIFSVTGNLPGLDAAFASVPRGSTGVGLTPSDFAATAGTYSRMRRTGT